MQEFKENARSHRVCMNELYEKVQAASDHFDEQIVRFTEIRNAPSKTRVMGRRALV